MLQTHKIAKTKIKKEILEALVWVIIFSISLGLSSYAPIAFKYPTAPGLDTYAHLQYILALSNEGLNALNANMPAGFHFLIIWISRISGSSFESTIGLVAFFLIPLSNLLYGLLARRLFGIMSGLITYLLLSFVSLQPLQTYYDGTFPNLLATGILLPITLLLWIKSAETRHKHGNKHHYLIWGFLGSLGILSIILTHHFTTLMMGLIFLVWIMVILIFTLSKTIREKRFSTASLMTGTFALGMFVLIWSFLNLEVFSPARNLLNTYLVFKNTFPFVAPSGLSEGIPWNMAVFGSDISGLVFQGGILGASLWIIGFSITRYKNKIPFSTTQKCMIFLFLWLMVYWFGATRSWTGEPTRLARDLALPASIFASTAIINIYNLLYKHHPVSAYSFVIICVIISWPFAVKRLSYQTHQSSALLFSRADEQAYQYLLYTKTSHQTDLVFDQPMPWDTIIRLRKTHDYFEDPAPLTNYKPQNYCILTEQYLDPNLAYLPSGQQYRSTPYVTKQSFTDNTKTVTIACE